MLKRGYPFLAALMLLLVPSASSQPVGEDTARLRFLALNTVLDAASFQNDTVNLLITLVSPSAAAIAAANRSRLIAGRPIRLVGWGISDSVFTRLVSEGQCFWVLPALLFTDKQAAFCEVQHFDFRIQIDSGQASPSLRATHHVKYPVHLRRAHNLQDWSCFVVKDSIRTFNYR
jgi:hypothetical protein